MKVKDLGFQPYSETLQAMQDFTSNREVQTEDELWLLEHHAVFSQGTNGQKEHLLGLGDIPLVQSDRGGQVTYHGPGQLVAYTLFDLKRYRLGIRNMVSILENSVIDMVSAYGFSAKSRSDAPGVYVEDRKLASLGLRVKRGACYHGISINVDMDLSPFLSINPCGYQGMEMINLTDLGISMTMEQAKQQFVNALQAQMSLNT